MSRWSSETVPPCSSGGDSPRTRNQSDYSPRINHIMGSSVMLSYAKDRLVTSNVLKPTQVGIFFPSKKRRYWYKATEKKLNIFLTSFRVIKWQNQSLQYVCLNCTCVVYLAVQCKVIFPWSGGSRLHFSLFSLPFYPARIIFQLLFPPESPDCHDVDDNPGPSPIRQVVHCSGYTPISTNIEPFREL